MRKQSIKVPGIQHLDNYRNQIQQQFPSGSFILDKKLTGCGATTMFLKDSYYTILCSPRLELMHCKANDSDFDGLLHEFRKADDRTTSVYDLQNQMMDYIRMMEIRYQAPYLKPEEKRYPKILVSYDSFKHVAQRLSQEGILGKFRIVVDEFQTLYTDAAFKGDVEIEFLQNLSYSNQIIYLSATPYLEDYLDQLPVFSSLPMVELVWPVEAYRTANIQKLPYYRQSITQTIGRIILRYQVSGYFEKKIYQGREVDAHEAVFFLNDVSKIITVIKNKGLTPDNTNIICARTDENMKKIEGIQDGDGNKMGFTIGHVPKKGETGKTYTFVTKCAFEGVDFYSPCAFTYIFSDITLKHLGLDISLDVPQILGRQRDTNNPFRTDAIFYYKTNGDMAGIEEPDIREKITNKLSLTDEWKNTFHNSSPELQKDIAKKLRKLQKSEKCEDDFIVVYDDKVKGKVEIETNYLAMYNELRAWQIMNTTYLDDCQVMKVIDETTWTVADDPNVKQFLSQFPNDFVGQMKLYCDTVAANPEIKEKLDYLPQVPIEIKRYYKNLGPEVIKKCSYMKSRIERFINTTDNFDNLRDATLAAFIPGYFYSLKEIKSMLVDIYSSLGIDKTAKASDLLNMDWLSVKPAQERIDGQKVNGYRIL